MPDKIYIDGSWIPSHGDETIAVTNPSTEETLDTVPSGTPADVDAAVDAARRAFEGWAATSREERSKCLQRIAEGIQARMVDLGQLVTREVGTPVNLSVAVQAGIPMLTFSNMADLAETHEFEDQIGHSTIVREPIGVVAAITPWNYPLHQIAAKIAPAMAAGCTVVLKPSEIAPLNAFALMDIIDEAGVPAGVVNMVSGTGPVVGEALAAHPDVDMVSFTGSVATGRIIQRVAAETTKRVALELGGKSPNVILDDADIAAAVNDGVMKAFFNSGQTCASPTRMLVPRDKLPEAEQLAVTAAEAHTCGDPFDPANRLGPLVSAAQRERVLEYIRSGIDDGAKLLTGGLETPVGDTGYYVAPTVFSGANNDMKIAREEIFGPVLTIIPYDTEDEAVAIANDSMYGLAAQVWSGDPDRAERVARRLRAGTVDVNGAMPNPTAPFGGYKQSGNGRELGRYGLDEFTEIKAIQK